MAEQRRQRIQRLRVVYTAVAGISVVVLTSLLQSDGNICDSLLVYLSLICFGVSIPALAGGIYVLTIETNYDDPPEWAFTLSSRNRPQPLTWPWGLSMVVVGALGLNLAYVGIVLTIFSISVIAGSLFLASSIFTFVVARNHEKKRAGQGS